MRQLAVEMAVQFYLVLMILRTVSADGEPTESDDTAKDPDEATPITWPTDVPSDTNTTKQPDETWPAGLPTNIPMPTLMYPHVPARTNNPLDALLDEEEYRVTTPKSNVSFTQVVWNTKPGIYIKDHEAEIAHWRKPLAENELIRDPFYFGCCHNSTNVGCAGVCPETCEYRSKYCVALCGPPCRCKRGFVYHISEKACRLRSECDKSLVQSKFGIYRVFL
ncbi:uncharacterized protein Dana_GF11405 [Drosophila ananassae]|uniref:TIL domain-containing protein n=2 Tax=Drosophila ananassae TaxID=7217 RepID=B3MDI5_DROAN|nr:uncharacterized protein Dana_GF11405 [Drosophila ananassae]